MAKKQDPEDITEPTPGEEPATEPTPQQLVDEPENDPADDWQARYAGLQKVVAKKDKALTDLSQKVESLTDTLEELRTQSTSSETQLESVKKQAEEAQEQLATLTGERDNLKQQLDQQQIVLKDYPQLAPLAEFIPAAENEEQFRTNAENFAKAIEAFTGEAVTRTVEGSTPPIPSGKQEVVTQDQVDVAYDKAAKLAGVPGKEQEYQAANDEYVRLLSARNNQ
jgi:chromosome segregation ATPase